MVSLIFVKLIKIKMNSLINIDIDCTEERKEYLDGKNIQEKIKSRAIQLCQAFIGGQWDHADQSQLIFEPIK